ncbi:MAG: cytochrome c3 family protein [Candidatus Neomarinimicrobiota bacterium]
MHKTAQRLAVLLIFFSAGLWSQDCVTGGCHAELFQKKVTHLPVEERDCGVCHVQDKKKHPGGKGSEMVLAGTVAELCTGCHDAPLDEADQHPPVAEGECTACHDPHQGDQADMLKGATAGEVCNQCHDTGGTGDKYIHGPVAVGACDVCHSSHGKLGQGLLKFDGVNAACYDCHEMKKEEINALANIHAPVAESCSGCHDPHSSAYRFQLLSTTPELCFECHGNIQGIIAGADSHHEAVEDQLSCYNCHNSHGSNFSWNLRSNSFDLCLSCHDQAVKRGKIAVPGIDELLKGSKNWHGPIKDRDCSGCHEPHGSGNFRLLRHYYPKEFYSEFDFEKYQLCIECHPPENLQDPLTTTMTNFRDGQNNMHFLHVNRTKGRTCRACHETHASNQPYHIRTAVPFGSWELPINFKATSNGGTCLPGCHKYEEYVR